MARRADLRCCAGSAGQTRHRAFAAPGRCEFFQFIKRHDNKNYQLAKQMDFVTGDRAIRQGPVGSGLA